MPRRSLPERGYALAYHRMCPPECVPSALGMLCFCLQHTAQRIMYIASLTVQHITVQYIHCTPYYCAVHHCTQYCTAIYCTPPSISFHFLHGDAHESQGAQEPVHGEIVWVSGATTPARQPLLGCTPARIRCKGPPPRTLGPCVRVPLGRLGPNDAAPVMAPKPCV